MSAPSAKRSRSDVILSAAPATFTSWQYEVEQHAQPESSTQVKFNSRQIEINDTIYWDLRELLSNANLSAVSDLISYFTSKFNSTTVKSSEFSYSRQDKRTYVTGSMLKTLAIASMRASANAITAIYKKLHVRIVHHDDVLQYITRVLPARYRCVLSKAFDNITVPLHIEDINVAIVLRGTAADHIAALKTAHGIEHVVEYNADDDPDALLHKLFELARA